MATTTPNGTRIVWTWDGAYFYRADGTVSFIPQDGEE